MNKMNKLYRNIKLDYLFTVIRNIDMSSSIWVLYLAYRGMSLLEIGILEGVYHITGMLFEIPSGAVADLLGRKKTIVVGRLCMTLSCICMLLANGFFSFALSFFIQALSANLNSGSEEALLYDSMKLCGQEEEFLKVSGRLNMLVEIAQAAAVVVGGILAEYSYVWCYGACIVIAMLGFMTALFFEEPPIGEEKNLVNNEEESVVKGNNTVNPGLLQRLRSHFAISFMVWKENKRIRNIVIYYSAIFTAYTLLFFYSQQYFYDCGLNKVRISLIMLVVGGVSCLGAACSEKLYQRLGEKVVTISALVIGLGIAAFGLNNLPIAITALMLMSYCNSLLYPIQSVSLNRLIPSEQRATLISVNSMAFSVGMVILFPVVGALADRFGLSTVFLGLGLVLTPGGLLAGRMKR